MSKPDEEVNCYLRDCVASFTVKKAQNPKDFLMIGADILFGVADVRRLTIFIS